MRDTTFVNGRFVPRSQAVINIEDRSCQFGDGVYEVVRYHGRTGLCLDQHLERLQQSAGHLRIEGAPSIEEWKAILDRLMNETELPEDPEHVFCLYQEVSRGVSPRNHTFPKEEIKPGVMAYFKPAPTYTTEQREKGIALSTQPDERWSRCYIKSVCLLPVVMAKQAAVEAGAFEALLVRDNIVTEVGATNVYCVKNGEVFTHPTGPRILSGVTRTLVLEAANNAGVRVNETPVTLEEFRGADEAFISSTTLDIMPATKLDGFSVGNGTVGPVTKKLMETIQQLVQENLAATAKVG